MDDIIDHTVGRALDLFGLDTGITRWEGARHRDGGGPAL
jgi:3-polyprenyl-4-hydroxybenzoate decarboxylase